MKENYVSAIKANIRFYFFPHIIISIAYILLMPIFFGVENLDSRNVAKLLELFVSIAGIICIVPIYLPEQYNEIYDLVHTKYMSMIKIYVIRMILGIVWFALIILGVLSFLTMNHNEVSFLMYFFGTFSTGLFLGSFGILSYTLFDNIAIAYMIPLVYYISNYGGSTKYFGKFILFSMSKGSFEEKYYLLFASIIAIILSLIIKHRK